jgi:hypothetical protein
MTREIEAHLAGGDAGSARAAIVSSLAELSSALLGMQPQLRHTPLADRAR